MLNAYALHSILKWRILLFLMAIRLQPKLMGILNVTPDSFFDGGAYFTLEKAIERGVALWQEGADIVDIGGASFRPGAEPVSEEEQIRRVRPVIEALRVRVPIALSIDTDKAGVAQMAVEKGVSLINNVEGFSDPAMRDVAAGCNADLCVMHKMPLDPNEGAIEQIIRFFEGQIEALVKMGVKESRIILDPGIGFGKTVEQHREIFRELKRFKTFGLRLLVGASRKASLEKILGWADVLKNPRELLPATLAIHTMALAAGTDILRVHDVKEHRGSF